MAAKGWGNVYAPKILSNYRVWEDIQGVRAARKMSEVMTTIDIYRNTLIPEYRKRGWSIAPLESNMRRKAIGFADMIDAPLFTEPDRVKYKALLRELGSSSALTMAIVLADAGLNPLVRLYGKIKLRLKDGVKILLRAAKPS